MTKNTIVGKVKKKAAKNQEPQPYEDAGVCCEICGEPLDMVEVVDGSNICWLCGELTKELDDITTFN